MYSGNVRRSYNIFYLRSSLITVKFYNLTSWRRWRFTRNRDLLRGLFAHEPYNEGDMVWRYYQYSSRLRGSNNPFQAPLNEDTSHGLDTYDTSGRRRQITYCLLAERNFDSGVVVQVIVPSHYQLQIPPTRGQRSILIRPSLEGSKRQVPGRPSLTIPWVEASLYGYHWLAAQQNLSGITLSSSSWFTNALAKWFTI